MSSVKQKSRSLKLIHFIYIQYKVQGHLTFYELVYNQFNSAKFCAWWNC